MSFSSLLQDSLLLDTLSGLGYTRPTPIQSETIPAILAGRDIMAGAQTGTGKTAAFALPILQRLNETTADASQPGGRPVRALVLTPTRELAQQVFNSFVKYGRQTRIESALAYGGISIAAQVTAFQAGVDIVVATPGRLLDHLRQGALSLDQLEFLVFDEADRMLDMGFIDEINQILAYVPQDSRTNPCQTLLFSATFDDGIFSLSKGLLHDPMLIEVDGRNTAAASVEQRVYAVDADRKRELICHLIKGKDWHRVLIFTRTRQGADRLALQMSGQGVTAEAFHGDLSQSVREKVLQGFKSGQIRALVATDVAARGLDIVELDYVINFQLPHKAEDYVHRIGRTGRAGSMGLAISLVSGEEELLLEEVEALLDRRLPQQWLPGFEPDLSQSVPVSRKKTRSAHKQRAKRRAMGAGKSGTRR